MPTSIASMETRKDVRWYEWLYKISSLWNVMSVIGGKNKILKLQLHKSWYRYVMLYKNGKYKSKLIHRLIANAFIKNIDNKKTVNHRNWIRNDNRLDNLEWMTQSENVKDGFSRWRLPTRYWLWKMGKDFHWTKTVWQYNLEWILLKIWDWTKDAAKKLWLVQSNVCRVCNGERHTHWGFIFKYL